MRLTSLGAANGRMAKFRKRNSVQKSTKIYAQASNSCDAVNEEDTEKLPSKIKEYDYRNVYKTVRQVYCTPLFPIDCT